MKDSNQIPIFCIKKRLILSFLITLIVLVLTSKYWLVFKSMPVSMDIKGNGICNIQVLLNKKDNDKFNKVKRETIGINLDEENHADLYVQNSKTPKRVKFIITCLQTEQDIRLSNVKIGNYEIKDLDSFEINGADFSLKNNELILKPEDSVITLVYPKTLNVHAGIQFDLMLFVIILILTYFLAYKFAGYISDFKTVQKKSGADILFLTIFFIFLFIPVSNINQDKISEQENRTLAKWQPLIDENSEINSAFGRNFNDWFNDRFFLRNEFISLNDTKLLLSRNWKTKDVMKGKDGWLFLGRKDSTDSYSNSILFTDEELVKIGNYLNNINNYCKKHNKKFYMMIVPDKSKIYEEFYPESIKKQSEKSRAKQLIEYVNRNFDIKIVYPKEKLLSHKKDNLLYWKTDTHWNQLGAYYGYSDLMELINKDFKTINTYKVTNYTEEKHNGDLYNMAPKLFRKPDLALYKIPEFEENNFCDNTDSEEARGIVTCYNPEGTKNMLMFRDSFSTTLIPYLSYSFKNSKFVWQYNFSPKIMENADIVILEIVERYLPGLTDSYME